MMEGNILKLREAIVLGAGDKALTYAEFELREPLAGELEKAARADTGLGQVITLISLIAKVPRTVAERIPQTELKEANDFLESFGRISLTTGETAPPS